MVLKPEKQIWADVAVALDVGLVSLTEGLGLHGQTKHAKWGRQFQFGGA